GHMSGFMAQAGTILIGGNAAGSLGDSLYEAVIYVGGKIRSLGADARVEELTGDDVRRVGELASAAGFSHLSPDNVTKVTSARSLYRFDAPKAQRSGWTPPPLLPAAHGPAGTRVPATGGCPGPGPSRATASRPR